MNTNKHVIFYVRIRINLHSWTLCFYIMLCVFSGTQQCDSCQHGTTGDLCDVCAPGHYGDPLDPRGCKTCDCNGHGDVMQGVCASNGTGECFCTDNTQGIRCDICQEGYYGNPRNNGTYSISFELFVIAILICSAKLIIFNTNDIILH